MNELKNIVLTGSGKMMSIASLTEAIGENSTYVVGY